MGIAAQFYALDALPTVSVEQRALTMTKKNKICCHYRELNQVSAGVQPIAYSQHHSILENTVINVRTSHFKVKNILYYNHTLPKLVSSGILYKQLLLIHFSVKVVILGVMSVVVVLVEGAEGFVLKTSEPCQNSNLVTFI